MMMMMIGKRKRKKKMHARTLLFSPCSKSSPTLSLPNHTFCRYVLFINCRYCPTTTTTYVETVVLQLLNGNLLGISNLLNGKQEGISNERFRLPGHRYNLTLFCF